MRFFSIIGLYIHIRSIEEEARIKHIKKYYNSHTYTHTHTHTQLLFLLNAGIDITRTIYVIVREI